MNELILSELIPPLSHRNEQQIIDILRALERIELRIVWSQIIEMQVMNLKNGLNKVGIPDLIIVQNALQNDLSVFSLDKHFQLSLFQNVTRQEASAVVLKEAQLMNLSLGIKVHARQREV